MPAPVDPCHFCSNVTSFEKVQQNQYVMFQSDKVTEVTWVAACHDGSIPRGPVLSTNAGRVAIGVRAGFSRR
jgi:hypothetical protein